MAQQVSDAITDKRLDEAEALLQEVTASGCPHEMVERLTNRIVNHRRIERQQALHKAIDHALREGNSEAAMALLATPAAEELNAVSRLRLQGRLALLQGDHASALDFAEQLLATGANSLAAHTLALEASAKGGHWQRAKEHLNLAIADGLDSGPATRWQHRIEQQLQHQAERERAKQLLQPVLQAMEQGYLELASQRIEQIRAAGADEVAVAELRCRLALQRGDNTAAQDLAEQLLRVAPDNRVGLHMAAEAAMRAGDAERALTGFSRLFELNPQSSLWPQQLIRLHQLNSRHDLAEQVLREAMARGADQAPLFEEFYWMCYPEELKVQAIAWAQSVASDAPLRAKRSARTLLLQFSLPLTPATCDPVADDIPVSPQAQRARTITPTGGKLKRPLIDVSQHADLLVARADHPTAVVLIFGGLKEKLPEQAPRIDQHLAVLNCSAVFLHDPTHSIFLDGIPSLAPDREQTVAYLRQLIAELGPAPLVCLGASAGGHAAILYGLELEANAIVSFSGPHNLTASFITQINDSRGRLLVRRLQSYPAELLDLRPRVRARGGDTAIHLVYGGEHQCDRAQAHYLAGEPGVQLHEIADSDSHEITGILGRQQALLPFLESIIRDATVIKRLDQTEALIQREIAGGCGHDTVQQLSLHGQQALLRKDYATTLSLAEQLLAEKGDDPSGHRLAAMAAMHLGVAERAVSEFAWLVEAEPDEPQWFWMLQKVHQMNGRPELAADLLRRGLQRGLDPAELFAHAHRMALPGDLKEAALSWARTLDRQSATPQACEVADQLLFRFGEAIMQPDVQRSTEGKASLAALLAAAPGDAELKRPLLDDSNHAEITVVRAERPAAIVLFFTGLADQAMMPLPILDRYFAALNMSVIYLRDPERNIYVGGISSVAPDIAATIAHLRRLISELGSAPLITIGASAGGFAAIRYGLELGASAIIGFSVPTNLGADFLASDPRAKIIIRRLQSFPADELDLKPLVRQRAGATPIHLFYGAEMPHDTRHAHYLADEAGVVLYPLAEVGVHYTLAVLAERGELTSFLHSTLAPLLGTTGTPA